MTRIRRRSLRDTVPYNKVSAEPVILAAQAQQVELLRLREAAEARAIAAQGVRRD